MNGQDRLRAAASGLARVLASKATGTPARPIRVGFLSRINQVRTGADRPITRVAFVGGVPGLNGNELEIPASAWSTAFLADVLTAEAGTATAALTNTAAPGVAGLTGRPVEIHFTDDQPVIAYLLGGPNG